MNLPPIDAESLSEFQRDSASVAARLKKSGQPIVLTIDGQAELVIQDAEAYRRLQQMAARAEAAEMNDFLTRSLADLDAGHTMPAEEFVLTLDGC